MHYIIWWFLSLFCKHTWKLEERAYEAITKNDYGTIVKSRHNVKVSATCNNCGWHRSYYKF